MAQMNQIPNGPIHGNPHMGQKTNNKKKSKKNRGSSAAIVRRMAKLRAGNHSSKSPMTKGQSNPNAKSGKFDTDKDGM